MLKNYLYHRGEKLLKWITGLSAFFFLAFSIYSFEGYHDLTVYFTGRNIFNWYLLLSVVLLIPLNWLLESLKWKILLQNVQAISLQASLYAVLTGLTTAIISPARIGEFAGRIYHLHPHNRKKGSILWLVGSITMTIVIMLTGIPAAFLYFRYGNSLHQIDSFPVYTYLLIALMCVICLLSVYLFIPIASEKFSPGKLNKQLLSVLDTFKSLTFSHLIKILAITLSRYIVFCLQFWLMLSFTSIELSPLEAFLGISTAYLFVTFLPSVFLTEAAVKSSVFLLVLNAFTVHSIGILGASLFIWILNVALPTLCGVLLLYKRPQKAIDKNTIIEENLNRI